MPLKRFFHSARRAHRSKSQHHNGSRLSRNDDGFSALSLDETKAVSYNDVNDGTKDVRSPSKSSSRRPHPIRIVHWNSASDLFGGQKPYKGFLSPETPLSPKSPVAELLSPKKKVAIALTVSSAADSPKLSRNRSHSTIKKKLSHFEDLSRLEYSPDGYRLTGQQRDLLKLCWRQATDRQGPPGPFIFQWVFAKYPQLKTSFGFDLHADVKVLLDDPTVQKHLGTFTDLLELVVSSVVGDESTKSTTGELSLDDTTGPLLHSHGARHARLESNPTNKGTTTIEGGEDLEEDWIRAEHWDILRTAMCEYASSAWRQNVLTSLSSSAQKRNEALHAWRILSYFIIAKIRQGYEIEKNELRKRGRGRSVAE